MSIKSAIRTSFIGKKIWPFLHKLKKHKQSNDRKREEKQLLKQGNNGKPHIFYCGICETANMGDMAQTFCTLNWLHDNYPEYEVLFCRSSVFMDPRCHLTETMRKIVRKGDLIFFQSGYNTHDLGGWEDLMHQKVIAAFPDLPIIMLPQTVYFKTEERKEQCSRIYDAHPQMLFFARDPISLEYAKNMFPSLKVMLYPDIVTSLIGKYDIKHERKGIYLCRRKDVEQYYAEEDYDAFRQALEALDSVSVSDTIISASNKEIYKALEEYVRNIISYFAEFRLIVTDKFHGLVFSLIAATPVIVLKTKDHKVTSGYEWFSKIYPDRVFYADSPEEAKALAEKVLADPHYTVLDDYFDREYYCKLNAIIKEWREGLGNL